MTLVSAAESETTEAAQAVAAMDGHDCAYEDYLKNRKSSFGGEVVLRAHQIAELEQIHTEGYCPPTHTSPTSPTVVWEKWLQTNWN